MKRYFGEFEQLVLLIIVHLDKDSYGVAIKQAIEEHSKRTISMGALHSALTRLEEKGYIKSWMGESTAERGGQRKKFFEVTLRGKIELDNMRSLLRKHSITNLSFTQ